MVKQFNRKQIPLTHKYLKYKADQSSSQFCRSQYRKQYQRPLLSEHGIKEQVSMVRGNGRLGSFSQHCDHYKTAKYFLNFQGLMTLEILKNAALWNYFILKGKEQTSTSFKT